MNRFGIVLGAFLGVFGALGALLGRFWASLGRSDGATGASLGALELLLGQFWDILGVLRCSWGDRGALLRDDVPEPIWGAFGRSWAHAFSGVFR